MLESWPVCLLIGTILGALSGLGVGGGSLLVLWLTLVLNYETATARSINLLFFLPSAAVACCFRWRQGLLNVKSILPAIIFGCLSAAVFSWVGMKIIHMSFLKKAFGILLIFTGIRELMYGRRKQ